MVAIASRFSSVCDPYGRFRKKQKKYLFLFVRNFRLIGTVSPSSPKGFPRDVAKYLRATVEFTLFFSFFFSIYSYIYASPLYVFCCRARFRRFQLFIRFSLLFQLFIHYCALSGVHISRNPDSYLCTINGRSKTENCTRVENK